MGNDFYFFMCFDAAIKLLFMHQNVICRVLSKFWNITTWCEKMPSHGESAEEIKKTCAVNKNKGDRCFLFFFSLSVLLLAEFEIKQ